MTFNSAFKVTPGHENCPKCFGWQVRDLTPRDKNGWPTGPCNIVDCDHCAGRGEILVKANPWAKVERVDIQPSQVAIDDAVPPPSGWPQGTPTHSTEWPKPSGWPS